MHVLRIRPLLVIVAVLAISTVALVRATAFSGQPVSAASSPSGGRSGTTTTTSGGKAATAKGKAVQTGQRGSGSPTKATGAKAGTAAAPVSPRVSVPGAVPAATTSTLPPATTTTTAAPAAGQKTIGVSFPALLGQPAATQAAELAQLKSIGVNSIRIGADWAYISYAGQGTYDWSQLDQEVASVRAAGMSIDMVVMGTPSWAAVSGVTGTDIAQPASPALFGLFAAAVAQRYAPQGVQDYEIWNEPNSAAFWLPAPNAAAYVQVLQASYTDIKAVDPGATVISGGLAPESNDGTDINEVTFLQDMYADGAKGYFDALGDHPYSYPALPDTEEDWSGWSQMDATPTSLESVLAANGDGAKPIWITEVGAPTNGPDSVGTTGQAEDLTQAIDNAKSTSWIGALYIYTYEDSGGDTTTDEDWFGLLNADGSAKPAWAAVAAAIG